LVSVGVVIVEPTAIHSKSTKPSLGKKSQAPEPPASLPPRLLNREAGDSENDQKFATFGMKPRLSEPSLQNLTGEEQPEGILVRSATLGRRPLPPQPQVKAATSDKLLSDQARTASPDMEYDDLVAIRRIRSAFHSSSSVSQTDSTLQSKVDVRTF